MNASSGQLSQGKRLGIASKSSLTPSFPSPPHSLDVSNVRLSIDEQARVATAIDGSRKSPMIQAKDSYRNKDIPGGAGNQVLCTLPCRTLCMLTNILASLITSQSLSVKLVSV